MSAAPLASAQIRSALWLTTGARVHAVIDGSVVPGLPARLREARCAGWDCLQRGALTPAAAETAAYIVELKPEADFTAWLLGEACTELAGWGVLMTSLRPLLAMREHSRRLGEMCGPDGRRRAWRWWDADLLAELLPRLAPSQLDAFFAPGQHIVSPAPGRWTWWQRRDGLLHTQVRERVA